MDSGPHKGNSDAAQTPTTLTHQQQKQNSNPPFAAVGVDAPELDRYKETHHLLQEPQTVIVQERILAGATTFTPHELVSAEKGPVLEGLEADDDVKPIRNALSRTERNARSAPLQQQRQIFSTLPAFPAATVLPQAQEANSKVVAAPMASAPAAYPYLEEVSTENNTKNHPKDTDKIQKGFCRGPAAEIPSAALFAATSQLYHTNSTTPALRISAAAHFMNLTLQASPGKVATWKDICSWGALYGFSAEDLRAAVGLVGNEGIISI